MRVTINRFAIAMGLALVAGLGLAGGASAETTVTQYVQTNAFATARWCEAGESGETCYEATLEVFDPAKFGGVGACLTVVGTGPDGERVEVGCADVGGAFALDPTDLATASLAPTVFALSASDCAPGTKECSEVPTRTVTVAVAWTAVGRTQKITDRLSDEQNVCVTHTRIKGAIQAATTTVAVDGGHHEGTGELQVLDVQDRRSCVAVTLPSDHVGRSTAQDAAAVPPGQGFVGSWRYAALGSASGPALATFGADGTLLVSAMSPVFGLVTAPADRIFAGTAHGAWHPTGARTAAATTGGTSGPSPTAAR